MFSKLRRSSPLPKVKSQTPSTIDLPTTSKAASIRKDSKGSKIPLPLRPEHQRYAPEPLCVRNCGCLRCVVDAVEHVEKLRLKNLQRMAMEDYTTCQAAGTRQSSRGSLAESRQSRQSSLLSCLRANEAPTPSELAQKTTQKKLDKLRRLKNYTTTTEDQSRRMLKILKMFEPEMDFYLERNPDFLEKMFYKHIDPDRIEQLLKGCKEKDRTKSLN